MLATWKKYAEAVAAFDRHHAERKAQAGIPGIMEKLLFGAGGKLGEAEQRIQQRRTHEQAFAFFTKTKTWERARTELQTLEAMDGPDWWKQSEKPWEEWGTQAEMHEGLGVLPATLRSCDAAIRELEARRKLLTRDELKSAFAANRTTQSLYFLAARAAIASGDQARAFHYLKMAWRARS